MQVLSLVQAIISQICGCDLTPMEADCFSDLSRGGLRLGLWARTADARLDGPDFWLVGGRGYCLVAA